MQIIEVNRLKELAELKKKRKVSSTSGFSEILSSSISENEEVASSPNVSGVESLLFLQEINSHKELKKQNTVRARDILEKLEEFKRDLLYGNISKKKLNEIKDILVQERARTDDPKLEAIIDEIELRASVEFAKYER